MGTLKLGNQEYAIIGTVKTKCGTEVPLLGIQFMSDEEWQKMAIERAIKQYTDFHGHKPADANSACKWMRGQIQAWK